MNANYSWYLHGLFSSIGKFEFQCFWFFLLSCFSSEQKDHPMIGWPSCWYGRLILRLLNIPEWGSRLVTNDYCFFCKNFKWNCYSAGCYWLVEFEPWLFSFYLKCFRSLTIFWIFWFHLFALLVLFQIYEFTTWAMKFLNWFYANRSCHFSLRQ